jgi:hypothetical protein
MSAIVTAVALLAMGNGEVPIRNESAAEVVRGPLVATLSVEGPAGAKAEVTLAVVLRNVSDQRASFHLERPGAEFFVRNSRGVVIHAPVPCPQIGHCSSGIPERTTLDPGEQLEFVERWRPRGGCLVPGAYTVRARLRAYLGRRPFGVGDTSGGGPFILIKEIKVVGSGADGSCHLRRLAGEGSPRLLDPSPAPGEVANAT